MIEQTTLEMINDSRLTFLGTSEIDKVKQKVRFSYPNPAGGVFEVTVPFHMIHSINIYTQL